MVEINEQVDRTPYTAICKLKFAPSDEELLTDINYAIDFVHRPCVTWMRENQVPLVMKFAGKDYRIHTLAASEGLAEAQQEICQILHEERPDGLEVYLMAGATREVPAWITQGLVHEVAEHYKKWPGDGKNAENEPTIF